MLGSRTDPDSLKHLDRALAAAGAIVAGIGADQWQRRSMAGQTPCTSLDVRSQMAKPVTLPADRLLADSAAGHGR
jgi:hypothetical protein